MLIQRYADPELFRLESDAFLLAHAHWCSYIYGNTRSLTATQLAERKLWLARLVREGETCGVAILTSGPPKSMLAVSPLAMDAAAALAQALGDDGVVPAAMTGEVATVRRLADCLGMQATERFRLGEHMLAQAPLTPPVSGRMRAATMADHALVLAWEDAFIRECNLPYDRSALENAIRERLQVAAAIEWLWEIDGRPVAKALGRPLSPIARIGMVYTAPEARGKGYAAALVGQLSAALHSRGCVRIFLATDMANPTSNAIYQRLGYRFTGESTHFDLEPALTQE